MEKNEVTELVTAFKEYRDLITPIEQSLREFSDSFAYMKEDLNNLNTVFDGNIQKKLDSIYSDLNAQAEKSKNLVGQIENFSLQTKKYISSIDKLSDILEKVESKISAIDQIEQKANLQIEKLNAVIEEKSKVYDLKSLEKKLSEYNENVQKISEFINKDIAERLKENNENILQIMDKNNSVFEVLTDEKTSVENLITSFNSSNNLLKSVLEKNDINEAYLFDLLDKWAVDRKVKTKK